MKIAFYDTHKYDRKAFDEINKKYNFEITYFDFMLNENTCLTAKGFDAVCVFVNDVVNKTVIEKLKEYNIQMIALRCAGFNNIDLDSANRNGITVVRVPSYSPHAIAEHTIGLILSLLRKLPQAYVRTRGANFSLEGLVGQELYNKTVGIIGIGKIGKLVAEILSSFGCKIMLYDIYQDYKWAESNNFMYYPLPELLQSSDIITLHCPLTESTKHLINFGSINLLKRNCILINTSRGALIETTSLIKALKLKKIAGAALDVYEEESAFFFTDWSDEILNDDTLARLLTFPNVIITSHQGFLTEEALQEIARTTLKNISELENGDTISNIVLTA
ncbi:MAG: 2-hydroxyacid dehydrogenase [Treponema sp.]|nr:2-hydroxyacid dehydrogenase [Candidatus Treponema merdequi]